MLSLSHTLSNPPPRLQAARPSRRQQLVITCAGPHASTPYEPLERAIQVLNRVITVGERAGWGSEGGGGGGGDGGGRPRRQLPERWVQFGAASSAQVGVEEAATAADVDEAPPGGGGAAVAGRSLTDYLALPVDEYSLLDPKWIERQEGGSFKLTIPLADLLGVDLTPQLFIEAQSDEAAGRVTLVGTRAALGSPNVDSAFRLYLTAVLSQRGSRGRRRGAFNGGSSSAGEQQGAAAGVGDSSSGGAGAGGQPGPLAGLRLRRPRHLPGRPVYRLRKLVARARGREWPLPGTSGSASGSGEEWDAWPGGRLPAAAAGVSIDEPPLRTASNSSNVAQQPPAGWAELPGVAVHNGMREGLLPTAATTGGAWPGSSLPEGAALSEGFEDSTATTTSSSSNSSGSPSSEAPSIDEWPAAAAAGKLYFTSDDSDEDCYGALPAAQGGQLREAVALEGAQPQQESQQQGGGAAVVPTVTAAAGAGAAVARPVGVGQPQPQLRCQVNVRVALRVPAAIRVVPNFLLGYSGSLLLKAVLAAVLPNFMDLLAADYQRWAGGAARDHDGGSGRLFAAEHSQQAQQQQGTAPPAEQ